MGQGSFFVQPTDDLQRGTFLFTLQTESWVIVCSKKPERALLTYCAQLNLRIHHLNTHKESLRLTFSPTQPQPPLDSFSRKSRQNVGRLACPMGFFSCIVASVSALFFSRGLLNCRIAIKKQKEKQRVSQLHAGRRRQDEGTKVHFRSNHLYDASLKDVLQGEGIAWDD